MSALFFCALLLAAPLLAAPPDVYELGAKPRVELRYAPPMGSAQRFTATTTMTTQQKVAGRPAVTVQPRLVFTGHTRVTRASDSGFEFELVIEELEARKTAGADKGAGRAAEQLWKQVLPLRVVFEVESRGRQERAQLTLPQGAVMPPPLREPLQALYELIRALHAPLPVQAVGKGARWSVRSERVEAGVNILRTTHWTLKSRRGVKVTLTFETTENAPEQDFEVDGLPAGMQARLAGVTGRTTGLIVVDLQRALPLAVTRSGSLSMRIEGRAGAKPFVIETKAESRVTLKTVNSRKRKRRKRK